MTDYARIHDFSVKDGLATGNAAKAIKGSEIDAELDAIVTHMATKAGNAEAESITANWSFTGLPTFTNLSPVVQVANVTDGALGSPGTTLMVLDDSIPQNDEGDQFMSLVITPQNTNNSLVIEVVANVSHGVATRMVMALFQDGTADALAAVAYDAASAITLARTMSLRHYMTAGTVSATTFKVRIGGVAAGTTTFNGSNGARQLGGVMNSSITITEIQE